MKKIFVSYGDHHYSQSRLRLRDEALATGWFDAVRVYSPDELSPDFRAEFSAILSQPRGGGYWLWKLDLLEQSLAQSAAGDLIVYCDAGCSVNPLAAGRFQEHVERLSASEHGMISFQMGFPEEQYTTQECFAALAVPEGSEIRSSGQIQATVIIVKACEVSVEILQAFRALIRRSPLVITDHFNASQPPGFIDHRHDQSIFSILRKQFGSLVLPDETWYQAFGCPESLVCPFWATRLYG